MDVIRKYFPAITQGQMKQYAVLKTLYTEWNEKINVISRKDINDFYEHHVLHSLAIAKIFSFPAACKIMDLGSGGGFPGIPLAIFFPEANFYLVDSIKKKMKVAEEIAKAVGLANVITRHVRAEDTRDQQFDVIVSRAVAPLKELLRWSKPLFKNPAVNSPGPSGLICLKGGDLNKEIAESMYSPVLYNIDKIFKEDYFKEKYILHVSNV